MIGRPRNISKEVSALELRAAGETQSAVAEKLGLSVRSIARYERRWRRGDRPLEDVLAALWTAYDREQHAWRRVRLLQSMSKVAVARAEEAQAALLRDPPARPEPREHQPNVAWRHGVAPDVAAAALEIVDRTRRSG